MATVVYRQPKRPGDRVRLATAPESAMRVSFAKTYREKRTRQTPIGPITEVEDAGPNMQAFEVTMEVATSERGRVIEARQGRGIGFALRASNEHLRRLTREDELALAEVDERRAEALARLREVEDGRRELLRRAWRRAEKVTNRSLIERAEEGRR